MNVYKQEENLLIKNQQVGGANNGLKAVDLKDAADFQRSRLTDVYQKQMETDRTIKKMELELLKMNKQLIELNQKAETSTSEIHVTVNAKETTNSNFTITRGALHKPDSPDQHTKQIGSNKIINTFFCYRT